MRVFLVIIMIASLLNACSSITETERKEIEKIIIKYNHALMNAYETGGFDSLREMTTDRQYKKVMIYIQSYVAEGEKIKAQLKEFKIKDIKKIDDKKVEAITDEKWHYERIDSRTGGLLVPKSTYYYMMKYELLKDKGNNWKVAALKVLSEKKESVTIE